MIKEAAAFLVATTLCKAAYAEDTSWFYIMNGTDEPIRVTLEKTGGKWDQFIYNRNSSVRSVRIRPHKGPADFGEVWCYGCSNIRITAVNGQPFDVSVPTRVSARVYRVSQRRDEYRISIPDMGEAAIAGELKRVYIANAQESEISF